MDSYKEGIDAKSGSSNGLIKGNYVINCRDVRPGIYVDAFEDDTEDITIMNNVVIGTGQGISLATENGGSLKNIWIKYNYVDVESNAFSIHRYDAPGTNLKINIYVIYNLLKSRDARSVHITDYPSNLINLRLFNNMKIGPIVWLR